MTIVHRHMGRPNRRIVTIPGWMFQLYARSLRKRQQAKGVEGGLNLAKFPALQCAELFIDKSLGCGPLGVTPDDIDAAIGQSVRLSMEVLDGKADTLGMRGE